MYQVRDLILEKARELYREREIFYPVDFMMELTMMLARENPTMALSELSIWARRRFGIELSEQEIRSTPPAKMRERLLEESRKFAAEDRLSQEIKAALACATDDELDTHLNTRFGVGVTERMRYLEPEERHDAIQARVENLLRTEQLHFERTILLEMLDNAWREHLYSMDQLRDGISFRAFSQQDPRIAYKREGARLFNNMMENVRDRVTDYVFKARIRPSMPEGMMRRPAQQQQQPSPAAPRPAAAPSLGGGMFGGGITGPGFDNPGQRNA